MEFSDTTQSVCGSKNGDTELYENTILTTRNFASAAPDTKEIKKDEGEHYESLRLSSDLNENKVVQVENTRKSIQWEDISNRMKYTVYIFSSILIAVNIVVIVVAVIIALPTTKVNGNWAQWLTWSNCDVTCDNGTETRMRFCINPAPTNGGNDCIGNSMDSRLCQNDACVGDWNQWSSWGSCSVSCDVGMQRRDRSCSSPHQNSNGYNCVGESREDRLCMLVACADGGWSSWGSWGSCSGTCGGGVRLRSRSCTNPSPSLIGRPCTGDSSDVSFCNRQLCPDYNVAFTAYYLNPSGTSYTVLQFRTVYLNNGDAYNTTTGKFTCKIPGVYYFAVTLAKRYKDIGSLYAYLRINNSNKLIMYFDPDHDNSNELVALPLTTSGTFHLNTNDAVYVRGLPSYFYASYSSFTGILLIPDQ